VAKYPLLTPEGQPYRPLPSQGKFHKCEKSYKAYIGGFGSGKTLCGAVEAFLTALRYPGSYGIVTRWSYRELEATSFKTLIDIIPPSFVEKFYKNSLLLILKNGSQIQGFNLQNHKRLTSLNLSWFWCDEVTEIEEDIFLQLQGRLRGVAPRRAWVTGNPNGRDWVWKTFVDQNRQGYGFYHARTEENTFLPQDYIDNLRKWYPAEWVTRFMEGSFDVFEGQIFNEFTPSIHVIRADEEFPIPREWPRFRAIDHGICHPTCCLWGAADPDGNLFIYDCYYQRNKLVYEHAQEINQRSENDVIDWTVIDPSTARRDAVSGTSIEQEYRNLGINTRPGENAILDGISRLKELLRCDPQHNHPLHLRPGAPRLHIFGSKCPELIWELQQYRWKDQRPGSQAKEREEPVDRHNHAIDALRYLVMANPARCSARSQSRSGIAGSHF
jgi:PBSX family phage terminase large subunit